MLFAALDAGKNVAGAVVLVAAVREHAASAGGVAGADGWRPERILHDAAPKAEGIDTRAVATEDTWAKLTCGQTIAVYVAVAAAVGGAAGVAAAACDVTAANAVAVGGYVARRRHPVEAQVAKRKKQRRRYQLRGLRWGAEALNLQEKRRRLLQLREQRPLGLPLSRLEEVAGAEQALLSRRIASHTCLRGS